MRGGGADAHDFGRPLGGGQLGPAIEQRAVVDRRTVAACGCFELFADALSAVDEGLDLGQLALRQLAQSL